VTLAVTVRRYNTVTLAVTVRRYNISIYQGFTWWKAGRLMTRSERSDLYWWLVCLSMEVRKEKRRCQKEAPLTVVSY